MSKETKGSTGVVYILTNPSFPDYVKIGYADDINKRLKELNKSECTPFAFRIFAIYDVNVRLSDMKIHDVIDKLNPNLRSIDTVDGKKRVREFYAMTPEEAYSIFEAIAEINGLESNLHLFTPTEKEKEEEKIARKVKSENFTFSKCGIRVGEKIAYVNDPSIECEVISDRRVLYENEEYSLSKLAVKLVKVNFPLQGPKYFTYKGEVLTHLRSRLEVEEE